MPRTATPNSVEEAARTIQDHCEASASIGIVLGTGLSDIVEHMDVDTVLAYESIPHFAATTALSHAGQLVCGQLAGTPVTVMNGRHHRYEGHTFDQVTFPIRVLHRLGVSQLIVTSACGSLKRQFECGHMVVVTDHISLMFGNAVLGRSRIDPVQEPRVSMISDTYDRKLIARALAAARSHNIVAHRGVYVAMTGPQYETRAEYRFLTRLGGHVVGMSTVPEVITARQLGMRVLGLSVVTNVCLPDALTPTCGDEVVTVARAAESQMRRMVMGVLDSN